jgi:two-component system NtrC family sensor kinase
MGHFSISLSPMRDESKQVNSVVVVMTDITDAALLQAKLSHSEKMATIGQLVSGVAHEVNNPLAAILGFTDLLLENPEIPEAAREDLRIILQETQRTKEIVQDLLSFARQRPAQREAVQVNAILRQTIKLRSYDFSSHGVEVVEEFDEGIAPTLGDAQQLQQVFLNILNNAYDAIQESGNHGKIRIRTRRTQDSVEIAFIDNGIGVTEPERIFDPFFTTKQVGKGTGLGLSICYGIVRAHGGEVLCWNNSQESGSTFVVRLPLTSESALAAAAAKDAKR